MKDYLLCFDVDGTLRDNVNHKVSASTIYTLKQLKKKGYRMIISSGRGIDSLERTGLMELISWDGYVCNNGQDILDADANPIFHASLSEESVIQTINIANQLGYAVVLKGRPRMITKEPDEYVYESQRFFKNVIPKVGTYHGQEVDAMIVYGPKGYDYAPFLQVSGINVLPGESTYADLTMKGMSKATGIQKILDLYGLKKYMAFGDSLNDMEMFLHADVSIAMGQGNQKLKDKATYVTSSIDEDGIYQACVHYKLIEEGDFDVDC